MFFKDRESVSKLTEEEADTIRESLILGEYKKIGFKTQIKHLLSDSTYVFMLISGGCIFSGLGGIGNTNTEIVSIWGYEEVKSLFFENLCLVIVNRYLEEYV